MARAVGEANDSRPINDEDAGQLSGISDGFTCSVSFSHSLNPTPPNARPKKLSQRSATETEGGKGVALGIGQAGERQIAFPPERFRLALVTLSDDDDLSASPTKFLIVAPQLGDVLAAKRSAQVPNEDEHNRLALPEMRESDRLTIGLLQLDIRRQISDLHPIPSENVAHAFQLAHGRGRESPRSL